MCAEEGVCVCVREKGARARYNACVGCPSLSLSLPLNLSRARPDPRVPRMGGTSPPSME